MSNQRQSDKSRDTGKNNGKKDSGFQMVNNFKPKNLEITSNINKKKDVKNNHQTERNAQVIKRVIVEADRSSVSPLDLNCPEQNKQHGPVCDPVTIQQQSQKNQGFPLNMQPLTSYLSFKQDREGNTPLHVAASKGLEIVSFEIIRKAPFSKLLDMENNCKETPLHMAIASSQPSIARRLVLAGCNLQKRDCNGDTPLHKACSLGDIKCVEAIVNQALPTEQQYLNPRQYVTVLPLEKWNRIGQAPLHLAAVRGSIQIVRVLLRKGAIIDSQEGREGRTALHLAIEYNHSELVKYLIRKGQQQLETPMRNGYTPYKLALSLKRTPYATKLLEAGAEELSLTEDSDSDENDSDSARNNEVTNPKPTAKDLKTVKDDSDSEEDDWQLSTDIWEITEDSETETVDADIEMDDSHLDKLFAILTQMSLDKTPLRS